MSNEEKNNAFIRVNVITYMASSAMIPKMVELFDKSLKSVWSQWYESNNFSIDNLKAGTYTLRLSLSSGVHKDETFDLDEGEVKEIDIDIANNSPHESHEWAYLNKTCTIQSVRDTNMKSIEYFREPGQLVNAKLWTYANGNWQQQILPQFMNQTVFADGNVFDHVTNHEISFLEISGNDIPNLYVSLPPANRLKCLVKLAEGANQDIHPIDVTVSTDHFKAETILTLLVNGALREAQTLSNAREAESLLQQKMVNPVTAAIGGYFLLKIGELERLHDWANNLANWFPWLPDGAIIHATQLLNKKEKTNSDIDLIRSRLLQAANIGVPVYSEGLRLLDKGLTQLWYHSKQTDLAVKQVLDRIGRYLEAANLSQETSTFIGISPSEPGRFPHKSLTVKDSQDLRRPTRRKRERGRVQEQEQEQEQARERENARRRELDRLDEQRRNNKQKTL